MSLKFLDPENATTLWTKIFELIKLVTGDVKVGTDGTLQDQITNHIANKSNPHKVTAEQSGAMSAINLVTAESTGFDTLFEYLTFLRNNGTVSVSLYVSGFSDLPRTDWSYGCTARLDGNIQVQIWRTLSNGAEGLLFREKGIGEEWLDDWTTGYLPLTGGTLSGNLIISGGKGAFVADGDENIILSAIDAYLGNFIGRLQLFLHKNGKVEPSVAVYDGSSWVTHYLFGEHNKPTGTYTGNGDATERVIDIGANVGSGILCITCDANRISFVMQNGAFGTYFGSTNIETFNEHSIAWIASTGKLYIKNDNMLFNLSGATYYYQVL